MGEPEARFDPLRRRTVLISGSRSGRPHDFRRARERTAGDPSTCHFCPGNEHETPPELAATREDGSAPDGPGWTVRVVPNRFPAVAETASRPEQEVGPYRVRGGFGVHEVVVESPRHDERMADYPLEHFARLMRHCQDRARALAARDGIRHVLVFRNTGSWSGASLAHPHTQILARDEAVHELRTELDATAEHRARTGRSLLQDVVDAELADGRRVVAEQGPFVCYAPFASRMAAEMAITPRTGPAPFVELGAPELDELARLFRGALRRLRGAWDDPDYNWVLSAYVSPELSPDAPHHWRIEILPRMAMIGGYELGSGSHINSVAPEAAAERLRAAGD